MKFRTVIYTWKACVMSRERWKLFSHDGLFSQRGHMSPVPVNVGDDPTCMGTAPALMSWAKGSYTI